jgi:hypothetical protein
MKKIYPDLLTRVVRLRDGVIESDKINTHPSVIAPTTCVGNTSGGKHGAKH